MLAERVTLLVRHRQAGIDAVCRSHRGEARPPKYHLTDGFILAHRGAGSVACCRLLEEGLVEPEAAEPIAQMVELEWIGNPKFAQLFAPFPAQAAEADGVAALVEAFRGALGGATGDPHSTIFPALALRAFAVRPELATPERLAGLFDMARLDTAEPPLPLLPELPHERDRFDASAFSNQALHEFAHAITAYPTYENSYCGHILTWALAIIDLHECGQAGLARLSERSWRNYLLRAHGGEADPFARHGKPRSDPPAQEQWPQTARFWRDRPVGNLESSWAHLPKYALGILALSRRATDAAAIARARELYHLMVY